MSESFDALGQAEYRYALRAEPGAVVAAASEARPAAPSPDERPPEPRAPMNEHLVSLLRPTSVEAEQYRALRHLVEQARRATELSIIGVSSPSSGDGKTLTAINLAGALAQAPGTRVLLVDLDLRKPAVARELALNPGENDVIGALLDPRLTLGEVVRPCPPFNLSVLPSWRSVNATYELLKSPRCGELLAAARERYDYVVVDLPPLVPIPDCRLVEKWVDGFFVVVAKHKTPRKMLEEALTTVDPSKVVGLVFNGDDEPLGTYTYGPTDADVSWWRRLVTPGGWLGQRFAARRQGPSTSRSERSARQR